MTTAAEALPVADRDRLVRYARLLAWSSLVWMTAEGVIAVTAGILANSIAGGEPLVAYHTIHLRSMFGLGSGRDRPSARPRTSRHRGPSHGLGGASIPARSTRLAVALWRNGDTPPF